MKKRVITRRSRYADPRGPEYWLTRPLEERFAAVEALRRKVYGDLIDQPMRKDVVRITRFRKKRVRS